MKPIARACLVLSIISLLLALKYASIGQASSSDRDTARYLLDRILNTRKKVNNFKCTVVYHNYKPKEAQQKQIEQLIRQGAPKKIVDRMVSTINEHKEYRFQKHKLAFDNDYRARVQVVGGISDAQGKLMKVTIKQIFTWDGESAIQYYQHPEGESSTAILSEKQPFETTKRIRQPWQQFGGDFCILFARAISDGTQINAVKEKDGKYRVELVYEKDRKQIAIVDPSQGYSLPLQEYYNSGQLRERYTAKFMEVSPNVWFPVEGEDIRFSKDDPTLLRMKSTVQVSDVTINNPNFYDGLFHIDFPKGARVIDHTTGVQYIVGESMSQKLYGVSGAQSIDEIAKDTLEAIAKETEQKHKDIEIFIPKVNIALKKRTLFILDLSDRKLIRAPGKPDSEKTHKYLTKIGEGDIAWDGTVAAIRGASILTIRQESNRPLTFTKGKWSGAYKLPEKVELPYTMLIVTKEETNYLMTVRKIESGGIRVTYRQLYNDELSRYK